MPCMPEIVKAKVQLACNDFIIPWNIPSSPSSPPAPLELSLHVQIQLAHFSTLIPSTWAMADDNVWAPACRLSLKTIQCRRQLIKISINLNVCVEMPESCLMSSSLPCSTRKWVFTFFHQALMRWCELLLSQVRMSVGFKKWISSQMGSKGFINSIVRLLFSGMNKWF